MPKLNLETKTKEEQKVKAYLETNASEMLAEKINNGVPIQKDGKTLINKKTMENFMSFACGEAKKLAEKGARYAMVDEEVVYGWAVHYFEENSIEGTLYNEDGSEYKKEAKKTIPVKKQNTEQKLPQKPLPQKMQLSLFDYVPQEETPVEEEIEEDEEPTEEDYLEAEEALNEQLPKNVDTKTGEILDETEDEPEDNLDTSAYDVESLAVLDEIFGNEMTLR